MRIRAHWDRIVTAALTLMVVGVVWYGCTNGDIDEEPVVEDPRSRLENSGTWRVDIVRDTETGCEFVTYSSGGIALIPGTCDEDPER